MRVNFHRFSAALTAMPAHSKNWTKNCNDHLLLTTVFIGRRQGLGEKTKDWNIIAVHGGYKKFVFCLSVTPTTLSQDTTRHEDKKANTDNQFL